MAITVKGGYKCGYCKKFYTDPVDADNCKEKHNLIYLALSKDDLNRLVTFLYTREERILGNDLVDRLQSYLKGSFSQEISREKETWEDRNVPR